MLLNAERNVGWLLKNENKIIIIEMVWYGIKNRMIIIMMKELHIMIRKNYTHRQRRRRRLFVVDVVSVSIYCINIIMITKKEDWLLIFFVYFFYCCCYCVSYYIDSRRSRKRKREEFFFHFVFFFQRRREILCLYIYILLCEVYTEAFCCLKTISYHITSHQKTKVLCY